MVTMLYLVRDHNGGDRKKGPKKEVLEKLASN